MSEVNAIILQLLFSSKLARALWENSALPCFFIITEVGCGETALSHLHSMIAFF
jgi:hypothetical protein